MKKIIYLSFILLVSIACNDAELKASIERGAVVYSESCIRCHMSEGIDTNERYPPLAGSNWLTEKRKETIHATKYGLRGEITVNGVQYKDIMIPMGLTDEEVADVLNYIMNSWGNTQKKKVTPEEVKEIPKKMPR
ncbi:MAG: c-type cytochrome [Altibacter sp.]|uniref:c-type cytochrome n=1 Tax=Altibacter sp. TaxID=2024823 RepID=UPI001D1F44CB|nr:cytochrome c [Altibacter sp.]MBZ0326445.1 c-type cytochrome [Altibacter sp.]